MATDPGEDAIRLCQELIRIDSVNDGTGNGPGERVAAEYVMAALTEVGHEPTYLESAPRRGNVVLRVPGADATLPALVVHGHTDVVPADACEWSVDPFSGELRDGLIWGRGAVDMKDMDAMILAAIRDLARRGERPRRDLVVAFFADEEAGGTFGARYLVDHHPDLFAGATMAISEVGGFSVTVADRRVYLLQTAEKSLSWLRLVATGRAGHGSQVNSDNAVTRLAGAVARIGAFDWPVQLRPAVRELLAGVADVTGLPFDPDDTGTVDDLVSALGGAAAFVGATLRTGANPTQLSAGYKANVIPGRAEAVIDVRAVPGNEEDARAMIGDLAGPGVRVEPIHEDIALEAPNSGPLVEAMAASLDRHDPGALVLPYMLSAGTDNKSLARLGIVGYGFVPLQLPPELDFAAMFHGVDERVPTDALRFGTRVLIDLLETY